MNRKHKPPNGHVAVTVHVHPDDVRDVKKAAANLRKARRERQASHEDYLKRWGITEKEHQERIARLRAARVRKWREEEERHPTPKDGTYYICSHNYRREGAPYEIRTVEIIRGPRGGVKWRIGEQEGRAQRNRWSGEYEVDDSRLYATREAAEAYIRNWESRLDGLLGKTPKTEALAILGVPAGATEDDIKSAWKRYAGQHHPDKGGDPESFKKGRAAYEALR